MSNTIALELDTSNVLSNFDEDLDLLRAFQNALHPGERFENDFVVATAAFASATGQVGGDLYDIFPLSDRRCAFMIGDVTGHAASAALVMAVLYGAAREAARHSDHPCHFFEHLHDLLSDLGRRRGGPRLFSATLFFATLEPGGKMVYSNAGHPSPILIRPGQPPRLLAAITPPIGLIPPNFCYEETVQLEVGDQILFYSDGILSGTPEELGLRIEFSADDQSFVDRLIREGGDDDRTAVLLRYLGDDADRQ